jgi:hypothetical protein
VKPLAFATGLLLAAILTGCGGGSETPGESDPPASAAPSSTPTDPSQDPKSSASSPGTPPPPGWPGALRADQASLPVVSKKAGRLDGNDAALGGIDIRRVSASIRPEWRLVLRARPPLASTLDPARRIMEHGIVVDSDGDRLADCRIGISTDAPKPGQFHVWVTDLRTGDTVEQVGGPYGFPFDFFHPAEGEIAGTMNRTISLFFLGGRRPVRCEQGPSASFYAYAVVIDHGQDPEWDFAPDAAWLRSPRGARPTRW